MTSFSYCWKGYYLWFWRYGSEEDRYESSILFDSLDSMVEQHTDMTGSSVALFTFLSLCELQIPINFLVALPLAENAISGNAYKNGAILTSLKAFPLSFCSLCRDTRSRSRALMLRAALFSRTPWLIFSSITLLTLCLVRLLLFWGYE